MKQPWNVNKALTSQLGASQQYYTGGIPQSGDFMNRNDMTYGGDPSGLFGNIDNYMTSDFMGGFSDLASGIGGLAGAYFGYQQMKDAKKNNSLYRNIMSEQQNMAGDFQNSANQVFGNTGRTDFQNRGSYA